MWWKIYLQQYKSLINRKLLLLYVFSLYFFYIILLFDIPAIINKLDLFKASSLSVAEYLKYPLCIATASWVASFLVPLWMIFILIFLANDWEGMPGQGYSYKRKYFWGKLSFAFTLPFDWALTALVSGLIMWAHWGSSPLPQQWISLLGLWLQLLGYVSFAVLIVTLFKNSLSSVLAFVGYFVLEAVVRKLLFSMNITMGFYLPAKVITSLVVPPAAEFVPVDKFQDFFEQHAIPFWINASFVVIYSVIFLIISYRINLKTTKK